jgi:class 3 adenylate cyclase
MNKRETRHKDKGGATDTIWLRKSVFEKFNHSILGLGSILEGNKTFEALAVIVDLKDFTSFCDQRDPHLAIPKFVKMFLEWLFEKLADELLIEEDETDVALWSPPPFFGKFLGDGVLLLWDVTSMTGEAKRNIVYSFDIICSDYDSEFLPKIKRRFAKPPSKLRCGIAQGQVSSIGEDTDFVGLCINIASRLQKLADGAFSFAFTEKGLQAEPSEDWYQHFRLIKIPIRGVSNDELIYVLKTEFRKLSKNDKKTYRE